MIISSKYSGQNMLQMIISSKYSGQRLNASKNLSILFGLYVLLRVILCGGNHLNATIFTWFNDARFFRKHNR